MLRRLSSARSFLCAVSALPLLAVVIMAGGCSLMFDPGEYRRGTGALDAATGDDRPDALLEASVDAPIEAGPSEAAAGDTYAAEVLRDGPIAYFRLADGEGSAAATNEIAGSAILATYPSGGATRGVPGAVATGSALRLDETGARLGLVGPLDFPGDVPFTIEAWFRIDDFTGVGLASDVTSSGQARTGWLFFLWDIDGHYEFRSELWKDDALLLYAAHPVAIAPGAFRHVVFFHSDVDHLDHLVVDGIPSKEGLAGSAPGVRSANNVPLTFGGFRGVLDELAIYDKALAPDRIVRHFIAR